MDRALPCDRAWALLKGGGVLEGLQWAHKGNFHCAFTAGERLCPLHTRFCDATGTLSVRGGDGRELQFELGAAAGREALGACLGAAYRPPRAPRCLA